MILQQAANRGLNMRFTADLQSFLDNESYKAATPVSGMKDKDQKMDILWDL